MIKNLGQMKLFLHLNWNIWCVTKQTFPEVKCNYIMLYIVNRLLNVAADNNHFFYLYKKLHLIYCIRARLRTKVFSTGHQRNDYIATWFNDINDHIFCNFTLSNENIDLFYPSYSHSLVVKYVECQLVITICLSKTITGKPLIKS